MRSYMCFSTLVERMGLCGMIMHWLYLYWIFCWTLLMGLMDGWVMVQTNYCFWNDVLSDGLQFAIWGCGCTARTHHGICALRIRQFGYAFGAPYVIHQYVTRDGIVALVRSNSACIRWYCHRVIPVMYVRGGWLSLFCMWKWFVCIEKTSLWGHHSMPFANIHSKSWHNAMPFANIHSKSWHRQYEQ